MWGWEGLNSWHLLAAAGSRYDTHTKVPFYSWEIIGAMTSKAFATRAFPLISDSIINGDLLPGLFHKQK